MNNKNSRFIAVILSLIAFIMLFTAGFHIGKSEEPYFVDRTQGWEPRLDVLCTQDDNGKLYVNVAQLTREEIKSDFPVNQMLKAEADEYPITAQDAYEAALRVKDMHGQGHINSVAGGAFIVYYSEKADAFFVTTNVFILGFAREDGRCLLYEKFGKHSGKGCFGSIVYGTDDSVEIS